MISAKVLVPLCVMLCGVPRCYSLSPLPQTSTRSLCEVKLKVLKKLLGDGGDELGMEIQGPVGPKGDKGVPGPAGDPGLPGQPGVCTCDLDAVNSQLAELQDFMRKTRRSPAVCYVGLSTGVIKPSQISATSVHNSCPISHAVLNAAGAWCTAANSADEWIQVDYLAPRTITGIATQGRGNYGQWVTSYQVSYGNTTTGMQYYQESAEVKIFSANSDQNTIVDNELSPPIKARYVRIHPVTYHGHMSMRIEMRDC